MNSLHSTCSQHLNTHAWQPSDQTVVSDESSSSSVKFGDTFRKVEKVIDPDILRRANELIDTDDEFFGWPDKDSYDFERSVSLDRKSKVSKYAQVTQNGNSINYQYNPISYSQGRPILSLTLPRASISASECKKVVQSFFDKINLDTPEPLQQLVSDGIGAMVEMAQWRNRVVRFIGINIIRYPITVKNNQDALPWHRDRHNFSLVVLMNDPLKGGVGYSGGGLNTARENTSLPVERVKVTDYYSERVVPILQGTIEKHTYEKNSGFFFSNQKELMHQGQKAEVCGDNPGSILAEKRLLTIFADTNDPVGR